ncbi:tetratricopeptide repeat protein [Campylobacterota bacterium DY0563]
MYKILFITLFIASTFLKAEEISAFGAGDLNSKNPYGLTSTEKNILNNKKTLGTIDSKVKDVKLSLESISERIDGLESIYEGDSQKLNGSVLKINEIIKNVEENSTLSEKHTNDIADLKNVMAQILTMQEDFSKSLENLKKAVSKISTNVSKINNSYISDKEFKSNMNQFITRAEFEALKKSLGIQTSGKSTAKSKSNKVLSQKDNGEILDEAIALFKKDYFTKAIPMFEHLVAENYKPATSNYYLGEMWYYRKKYEDAISYFKTSAMLYDKASYMPKLLLHSAISFEETKDFSNAANFYNSLIDIYPDSKEAKIAVKNLANIK